MSSHAPPNTVRIKRKREDEPVENLFIERSENHNVAAEFHYRLVPSSKIRKTTPASSPTRPRLPSRPSVSSPLSQPWNKTPNVTVAPKLIPKPRNANLSPTKSTGILGPGRASFRNTLDADSARRYHLTRPTAASTKRKRDPEDVAVFVEKKWRSSPPRIAVDACKERDHAVATPPPGPPDMVETRETRESRPLKRPSRRAASAVRSASVASTRSVHSARPEPSVEDLTELMKFAADVSAEEERRYKTHTPPPGSIYLNGSAAAKTVPMQPRAPAPRHRVRHPELHLNDAARAGPTSSSSRRDAMDIDGDDGGSDTEYVYDTYVRERSDQPTAAVKPDVVGSFGWVVIDEDDAEVWDFYGDSDDEVGDYNSDEDDENAENYYGADYPEDELDSADELDRDAYRFRRGASDDEEWAAAAAGDSDHDFPTAPHLDDEDDGAFSADDDDDDDLRYPWRHLAGGAASAC